MKEMTVTQAMQPAKYLRKVIHTMLNTKPPRKPQRTMTIQALRRSSRYSWILSLSPDMDASMYVMSPVLVLPVFADDRRSSCSSVTVGTHRFITGVYGTKLG